MYLKRKMKKSTQKNALPYCEIRNNHYLCTRKTEILNASLAQLARARDLLSRGRWFESDKRLKGKERFSYKT